MTAAFVRETDADVADPVLDRPVSDSPNFVTVSGLRQIDTHIGEFAAAREAAMAAADEAALPGIDRELRYWRLRRGSAQVIEPAAVPDVVRFGVQVRLEFGDGTARDFRLVGEDEADPGHGLVSYASPVGKALLGRRCSDSVEIFGQPAKVVSMKT
ncbi:MAG TPA: GreA/GreB family elongation factor [Steroidobacteraceae bacterium]|nr:GreA/GreB family elongation factor [Steroidobacteraceae bacterium]